MRNARDTSTVSTLLTPQAIDFLIAKNFLPDLPQEVANFLRVYKGKFDPAAIGDFLGEGTQRTIC